MNNNRVLKESLRSLRFGINRFYDEGFYEWTKENILGALNMDVSFDDPILKETLMEWENIGVIKIIGRDDCYFKILKKFTVEEKEKKV